jgi:hypothetical protein
MIYIFGPLIRVIGEIKLEKCVVYDSNTENGLKSSFFEFYLSGNGLKR